jgi:hypothetical protein
MTRTTIYHSPEWMLLVETGWITMQVNNNVAYMLYHPKR